MSTKKTTQPLVLENLSAAALALFREAVNGHTQLNAAWRTAILADTADGFPSALTKTATVGKPEDSDA